MNSHGALAQEAGLPQIRQPGDVRPPLPNYQDSKTKAPLVLPPAHPATKPDSNNQNLSTKLRVFVRQFKLSGNQAFSNNELAKVLAPYENRMLTAEQLQEARFKVTRYYVDRGYINSGAVIPDQDVSDGSVHLAIKEGRLTEILVSGNHSLRSRYVTRRIAPDNESPLNILHLQQRLQLLQQNPLIERVNAELSPGIRPGESILTTRLQEAQPLRLGLTLSNDRAPSVGAESAQLHIGHRNLSGWGDVIQLQVGITEGVDDFELFYSLPLNAQDTTLSLNLEKSESDVVEEPFNQLHIQSRSQTYGISLTHPFYRNTQMSLTMGLALERRHSETSLLGRPFSFSPGVQDGESDVTVLRISQDWLNRSLNQVVAMRSTFSLGINALDATINDKSPDGRFLTWLYQFQWAKRFSERGEQLLFRTDVQLALNSLLPLEQIAVGGSKTVRGYRENQLVRDNAFVASLEYRIPVLRLPVPGLSTGPDDGSLELAPFADFARAWNNNTTTPDPKTISSIGVGIRWSPAERLQTEIHWAKALRHIDNPGHDLQDSGIHFKIKAQLF